MDRVCLECAGQSGLGPGAAAAREGGGAAAGAAGRRGNSRGRAGRAAAAGRRGRRRGRRPWGRRPWARGRPRSGGKRRGGQGDSVPLLTLGCGGARSASHGGRREAAVEFVAAALGAGVEGWRWQASCGARGRHAGPIYRRGEAVERGAPVAELGGH